MINKGLVVIPTQGFANRMKILASAKIYADDHNLELTVCWIPSEECNINLEDVFVAKFLRQLHLNHFRKLNIVILVECTPILCLISWILPLMTRQNILITYCWRADMNFANLKD